MEIAEWEDPAGNLAGSTLGRIVVAPELDVGLQGQTISTRPRFTRIRATALDTRGWRHENTQEEVGKLVQRIGDVERSAIVEIRSVQTARRCRTKKQKAEAVESVCDIDDPTGVVLPSTKDGRRILNKYLTPDKTETSRCRDRRDTHRCGTHKRLLGSKVRREQAKRWITRDGRPRAT